MFLSAVWTFNLTAPIHCRASISVLMEKQSHLTKAANFFSWGNYCFNPGLDESGRETTGLLSIDFTHSSFQAHYV